MPEYQNADKVLIEDDDDIAREELMDARQRLGWWLADQEKCGRHVYEVTDTLSRPFQLLVGPEQGVVFQILDAFERRVVAGTLENHLYALDEFLADPPGRPYNLEADCPYLADALTCDAVHDTLAALWDRSDEISLATWYETPEPVRRAFLALYAWRDRQAEVLSCTDDPGADVVALLAKSEKEDARGALDEHIAKVREQQSALRAEGKAALATAFDDLLPLLETIRDALPFPLPFYNEDEDEEDGDEGGPGQDGSTVVGRGGASGGCAGGR